MPLTSLTRKLEAAFKSSGINHLRDSTKKHIRRKIESEFGSTLQFIPDSKGKLLAMPESLSLKDTVREKYALEKELELSKSTTDKIIDQSSSHIRKAILSMKYNKPWPIHPSDSSIDSFPVPDCLKRFLLGIIANDPELTGPSHRIKTLMDSFSHDIIYAVSCGQIKPPKQVLLSYGIKSLTGNVELIQVLNRLGHGVSYTQLEENDTALCLQKMASNLNATTILPQSIKGNVFTNFAWDNIDRLEETITGGGTTHRVNGIVVQPQVYGPHLPNAPLPLVEKCKQRSITLESQPLSTYISGDRVGPQQLTTNCPDNLREAELTKLKDFVWLLARISDTNNHQIPSWTGFNIATRDAMTAMQDVIEYLPTINAPATQMTTVSEILNQSEKIRKSLHLQDIVVVMDQALYAKASEIAWKQKDAYANIILRLGTFHTICNVLSIIGKRFQDAGLRDLCIESGIIAEGSITSVLDGKMYNRAVRVHKCIFEAFHRLAWQEFIPWITANCPAKLSKVHALEDEVELLVENLNQEHFDSILESQVLVQVHEVWRQFLEHLRHTNGDLSAFWMSYIQIVGDVLLGLIRASREGNWQLHLFAIRQMIPWCFAYDKMNYARYLPAYYAQMTTLEADHPEVYQSFMEGQFSVPLAGDNPFGRLAVDQTTEVTVNKDTKIAD